MYLSKLFKHIITFITIRYLLYIRVMFHPSDIMQVHHRARE